MTTNPLQSPADGDVDPHQYLWQLTRAHVDHVLHYTHWIPVGRGFTEQMLAEYYPSWTLGGLIRLFDKAGIRITPEELNGAAGAPHGGRCHWQVVAFYFTDDTKYHVVWDRTLEYDTVFTHSGMNRTFVGPGGEGPKAGRIIKARRAARPVDLSGKVFFD
jgi:hypothetical protein